MVNRRVVYIGQDQKDAKNIRQSGLKSQTKEFL